MSFENQVLPIFDQPEEVAPPVKSKKQQDDDKNKIQYRRHKSAKRVHCEPCISANRAGEQPGIYDASYVRIHGPEQLYLCMRHKQAAEHRDQLDGRK